MSEEIIKVLDYLASQLGLAIDWTSENVWPQVIDVLGRYRLLELVSTGLLLLLQFALIIIAIVIFVKAGKAYLNVKKTGNENFWWTKSYSSVWSSGAATFLMIFGGIAGGGSAISAPFQVYEILKWLIVPEIQYLEMLRGLMP